MKKDKVIEALRSGGVRTLGIREDGFAGPAWIDYQYFAES
jgi:hypothetical protein